MAQEVHIKNYYSSISENGEFIDINTSCKIAIEFFVSQLLFKGDISRVIYSKEDICFRRRIELLGNGTVKENKLNILGLDIPFAVYSQTGPYEEDDRGATQNTGQIVRGQIQPDTGIILRGAATKVKYNITAFYSRRDDVNIASQLLFFEKTPQGPFHFLIEHTLMGYPLEIPVFITVDNVDQNVEYNEMDWLSKSKIFPIKIDVTARTYQTLIESTDENTIGLPLRFSGLYGYNKNHKLVLTQETVLLWGDEKFTPNGTIESTPNTTESLPEIPTDPLTDKEIPVKWTHEKDKDANDYHVDTVQGYFNDERDIVLKEFYQDDEETTETDIKIKWEFEKIENFDKIFQSIIVFIPGIINSEFEANIIDNHIVYPTECIIKNLYPGSEYDCLLITKSTIGNSLTFKLNIKTKGEKAIKKLSDTLVGKTFQKEIKFSS